MKPPHPIAMTFIGGPLHRQVIQMTWIPPVNVVTDIRDRRILIYIRDETAYYFDKELSDKLTLIYDDVHGKFPPNKVVPLGELKKLVDNQE